jgi:acyl-CoA synthetase (AMP-forming)/AMP-acid ligase II
MVISGGVNIYPAEIEAVLHSLPGVHDCAVFGIPDEEFGEALIAVVEPQPSAWLNFVTLRQALGSHLANYKVWLANEEDVDLRRFYDRQCGPHTLRPFHASRLAMVCTRHKLTSFRITSRLPFWLSQLQSRHPGRSIALSRSTLPAICAYESVKLQLMDARHGSALLASRGTYQGIYSDVRGTPPAAP